MRPENQRRKTAKTILLMRTMWMWRHDKSWVENFLSVWTPLLLAALAVTSLLLRYVRDPITCHYIFPAANEYFTEYCFQATSIQMRSEEFVKFQSQVSQASNNNNKNLNPFEMWPKQRTYHHWVPFALGLGAALCLLPYLIWRFLNGCLWIDNHALAQTISASDQSQNATLGHGHATIYKDSALVVKAGLFREGNWMLTAAALTRKLLACAVCLLQMVLVVVCFKPPLGGVGVEEEEKRNLTSVNVTAPDVLEDVPLPVDPFFCTLEVTQRRNVHSWTMQCLLPLNQVYVKGFTFLFYFFLVLLILCAWDVFYWLGRLFLPRLRDVTLLRNLSVIDQHEDGGCCISAQFILFLQFLGPDGRLMLALVADHCGSVSALRFTNQLWQVFTLGSSPHPLGSAPKPFIPAPLTPSSAPMESSMTREAAAGGNGNADDIPFEDISQLPPPPPTTDDTAKLCPV
ncbi:hypothetical protein ACOMHN_059881 [Nucella lapillus]